MRQTLAMPDELPQIDPRRVRFGLALVTVVFLVALVLLVTIDDTLGRAVMAAIVVVAVVRAFLLMRQARGDAATRRAAGD